LTPGANRAHCWAVISPGEKLDTRFQLKVFRRGKESAVAFADLLTRRTIVSVYMRNNTPGCDRQNDSLAAHAAEFDRAGYNLVALSRDTCGSHAKYAAKKRITYTLASDPEDRFARAADAVVAKSMYGRKFTGPARAAFVLDRDGTVLAVAAKVDMADHAAQLRALLAPLR
jgi:thioredoxin-dependent peroxiredoxin